MPIIIADKISKKFTITKKEKGFAGAVKGLFFPDKTIVDAVKDVSFTIDQGEIVGYIGPNGAGKSTTIKILSGIMHPTSGSILINGISPQADRKKVVKNIGVVFGQKTQLYWDIRLGETFELVRRIYRIDDKTYKENLGLMNEMLGINEIIDVPVRQLSLGQRMKGDLTAATLYSPKILFLDEPTIGLDLVAKHNIRKFILDINRMRKTTVILTTHDLNDVEQLCSRLMVINKGQIIEDGGLDSIVKRLAPNHMLIIESPTYKGGFQCKNCETVKYENGKLHLKFDRTKLPVSKLISEVAKNMDVVELSVVEPDIEDAISNLYRSL
ncbi:MAG: ATP-binding cassette domain-containing protein [Elusimicrobiota bacterium]